MCKQLCCWRWEAIERRGLTDLFVFFRGACDESCRVAGELAVFARYRKSRRSNVGCGQRKKKMEKRLLLAKVGDREE